MQTSAHGTPAAFQAPPEAPTEDQRLASTRASVDTTLTRKSWVAPTLACLREHASSHDHLENLDRQAFSRDPIAYPDSAEARALLTARMALSRRMEDFVDTIKAAGALLHIRWAA